MKPLLRFERMKAMLAVEEVTHEIEALRRMEDGTILVLVPRLIVQMTRPDRAEILEWHVKEGDIVQPDAEMVTLDFLQDDWYLPVPPVAEALRVVRIVARAGDIVHLHDPLIVFALLQQDAI
jgi:pyruvate/2-oxoglutarate dehydrogenase complex dihydrolipoamide acyltransferase (E2) component